MPPTPKKRTPTLFSSYFHFITHFIPNWEEEIDPSNPTHQLSLMMGIHEMAEVVPDRAVRTQLQGITKKSMAEIAKKISG
jgi:hypothetical protein